ncbi:MAG: phosphoribosylanthranilate isomerase [Chloroflexi bacterium]|nr:phosphoribosylanthranilate isomerase [Chloroflexota bacterium]
MSALQVKICGVTAPEHALAAAEEGAAFIGLNFYAPSPRFVTVEQAQAIAAAVRALPDGQRPRLVGVFVNESPVRMREVAAAVGLDLVQLSGDESWDMLPEIGLPVIKAVRFSDDADPEQVLSEIAAALPVLEATGSLCLLDAAVAGQFGGTGHRVNTELARSLAARLPLMLAGGLTPESVAGAVAAVRPWGVDVSSGVETNRVKDIAKIRAFVRNALHPQDH